MQCCVSFCRNTSHNVFTSEEQGKNISFHDFPSEAHLRAAWLRALGKDDSSLTYPAVVCSQHFLYDDIYETQSGLRQIVTGAIPSTVQVCMICLDTDSKLILMSKHKLEKAYEKLTGQPFCLQGNLKQTLCVQCAQRLINFSRFGDKSLRARALMMDLVDKHELINREQKEIINRAKHQQKSTMVLTTLGLNNSDLRIPEHPSEDTQIQKPRKEEEENRQTELEETGQRVVVKTEESDVSMSVDGDTEVKHEHNNDKDSVWNPLKDESITFQCTLCMEEFVHEHAYIQHVCIHLKQNGEGDGECDTSQVCKPHTALSSSSSHSSLITENKSVYLPVPVTLSSIRVSTSEEQGTGYQGALGKQDGHPSDSAVVCSQHFLNDDIYETECGLRQIVTGAIPSTVQVCMICLDTDSKLILMSKHQLEKAYEKLTGHPSCYLEKRKQTLCLQCAQRLIEFSIFRFNSLRARAQIMDFVKKHELITRQHFKKISSAKPKSNIVMKMEGLNNSDLRILEHPSEDRQIQKPRQEEEENRQTELEETGQRVVVKTEESDVSMSVDVDMEVKHEDDNNVNDFVQDPLKYESVPFQCTLCLQEFDYEHAYMQHMIVHLQQNGEGDGECDTSQVCKPHTAVSSSSSHSSLITENKQADPGPCAQAAHTAVVPPSASLVTNDEINPTEEVDTNVSCRYERLTDCFVKLNDIFAKKVVHKQDVSLMKTRRDAISCAVSEDFSHQATSQNEIPTTEYIEPVTNSSGREKVTVSKTLQSKTDDINIIQCNNSSQYRSHTAKSSIICDICGNVCNQKCLLVKHEKTHTEDGWFTCKVCQYKCKYKSKLAQHMKTHTGVKPYACELCEYKCAYKRNLVHHMRTHTGEKPLTCNICNSKFARSSHLVCHMRSHTGVKPYACELCEYKCAQKCTLVHHMRIHTGGKPYSCQTCEYKFSDKSNLVRHMRTHTGEILLSRLSPPPEYK